MHSAVDVAITQVVPALGSRMSAQYLQPVTAKVSVRVHGDVANLDVRAELWCNIPTRHNPSGDWHAIPMVLTKEAKKVTWVPAGSSQAEDSSSAYQHEDAVGAKARRLSIEALPEEVYKQRLVYEDREYSVTVIPVKAGQFELTARVALEPRQWSPASHRSFPPDFRELVHTMLLAYQRPGTLVHKLQSKDLLYQVLLTSSPITHNSPQWLWAGNYKSNSTLIVEPPMTAYNNIFRNVYDVIRFAEWYDEGLQDVASQQEELEKQQESFMLSLAQHQNVMPACIPSRRRTSSLNAIKVSPPVKRHLAPIITDMRPSAAPAVGAAYVGALLAVQIYANLEQDMSRRRRSRVANQYICRAVSSLVRNTSWVKEKTNCVRLLSWAFEQSRIASEVYLSFENQVLPSQDHRFETLKRQDSADVIGLTEGDILALEQLTLLINQVMADTQVSNPCSPMYDAKPPSFASSPRSPMIAQSPKFPSGTNKLVVMELAIQASQSCTASMITPQLIYRIVEDIQLSTSNTQRVYLYQLLKTIALRPDVASARDIIREATIQSLLSRAIAAKALGREDIPDSSPRNGASDKGASDRHMSEFMYPVGDVQMLLKICMEVFLHVDGEHVIATVLVPALVRLLYALTEDSVRELTMVSSVAIEICRKYRKAALKMMKLMLRSWPKGDAAAEVRILGLLCRMLEISGELFSRIHDVGDPHLLRLFKTRLQASVQSNHVNIAMAALRFCQKMFAQAQMDVAILQTVLAAVRETGSSHWHVTVRKFAMQTGEELKIRSKSNYVSMKPQRYYSITA